MINRDKNGFTLVELMIAVTVFSVLLILSAASLTQISRLYYKAVIVTKTQNVNRNIMNDIAQAFQFSSGAGNMMNIGVPDGNGLRLICIGNIRYTYALNKQINSTNKHALWRDKVASCAAATPLNIFNDSERELSASSAGGIELLEPGMRLKSISVGANNKFPEIMNINIAVIYGDDDLINFSDSAKTLPVGCKGDVTGSQWCAFSRLYTQVFSRVKS